MRGGKPADNGSVFPLSLGCIRQNRRKYRGNKSKLINVRCQFFFKKILAHRLVLFFVSAVLVRSPRVSASLISSSFFPHSSPTHTPSPPSPRSAQSTIAPTRYSEAWRAGS